ncbi:MAG: NDP-sugar synthase [bacterium]
MPVKAVLHTGLIQPWAEILGDIPWPLLPVGNRHFLEYWFEVCIDLGIKDVRIILGEGAEFIEGYAGDGEQWGLSITYSFLKEEQDPDSFLMRNPEQWVDGLLYLRNPVFLHRLAATGAAASFSGGVFLDRSVDGSVNCLLSDSPDFLRAHIASPRAELKGRSFNELNLKPALILSIRDYYALNMSIVGEEAPRYVRAGYSLIDDVSIGYNVVIPPSVSVTPPVAIGNNSRIGVMASVGPLAVIGNHVIIDRQSDLSRCVILDGTYVGRGLEIRGKIVAGGRLIDPDSGTIAEINDPWLVAAVRPMVRWGDALRAVFGWLCAMVLVLLQAGPFIVLYPLINLLRKGRFRKASFHLTGARVGPLSEFVPIPESGSGISTLFQALNLDLFPRLCRVVMGQLWLCGVRPMASPEETSLKFQLKEYFPAVLVYETDSQDYAEPGGHLAHALYYARFRSFFGDVKMILSLLLNRPLRFLSTRTDNRG